MSIIIQLPTHKLNKRGQLVPIRKQKGDTCWYYAARWVREFHGQVLSGYSNEVIQALQKWEQMRVFWPTHTKRTLTQQRELDLRISRMRKTSSEVHRLITEQHRHRIEPLEGECILPQALLNDLQNIVNRSLSMRGTDNWALALQHYWVRPGEGGPGVVDSEFYHFVAERGPWIDELDELGPKMSQSNLYAHVWGFHRLIEASPSLGNPFYLQELLAMWGPLVVSGRFYHEELSQERMLLSVGGNLPFQAMHVDGAFHEFGHVIVLCGVLMPDWVVFGDPNFPSTPCVMKVGTFNERLAQPQVLHALPCSMRPVPNFTGCQHTNLSSARDF